MTDEQYIIGIIRDTCVQHHASHLIDDFSFSVDKINSCQKRCTLRFCNELPSTYDIKISSNFETDWAFDWGFRDWLIKTVRNYIFDAKALPYEDAGFDYQAPHEIDIRDHSEDAVDALCYGVGYICNGRANGKTKILYNRGDNLSKYSKYFDNKKGTTDMATERYMSESEARYDAEVKKIDAELEQAVADAQYQAQSKRCEVEKLFREERIKEQEEEKAFRRKAYYDGLLAAGFNKDEAMKILLEEI